MMPSGLKVPIEEARKGIREQIDRASDLLSGLTGLLPIAAFVPSDELLQRRLKWHIYVIDLLDQYFGPNTESRKYRRAAGKVISPPLNGAIIAEAMERHLTDGKTFLESLDERLELLIPVTAKGTNIMPNDVTLSKREKQLLTAVITAEQHAPEESGYFVLAPATYDRDTLLIYGPTQENIEAPVNELEAQIGAGFVRRIPMGANIVYGITESGRVYHQRLHSEAMAILADSRRGEEVTSIPATQPTASSRKVFIVHGHDHDAMEEVRTFVLDLSLEPIVLFQQPNRGRTLDGKLKGESDVGFVIVPMTPDDEGREQSAPDVPEEKKPPLEPRARENVIYELGFFIGKLESERVCALVKGKVGHPSDFHGVVYETMDAAGTWRYNIAREMRAAGLPANANAIPTRPPRR